MIHLEDKGKAGRFEEWAKKTIELLDEVKPYRGIFYKHRVAELKKEFQSISNVLFDDGIKSNITILGR